MQPLAQRDSGHVYHLFVVRSTERDALRAHLRASGVETLIHYPVPLPTQPAFAQLDAAPAGDNEWPVAAEAARTILSLPLNPRLTDAQIERISSAVNAFQKGHILA